MEINILRKWNKNGERHNTNATHMFRNYIKVAFRNITRHKTFSVINIAGLAVGIASALLLFVVVKYELSYNADQPNFERIYHIATEDQSPDGLFYTPGIPFPALPALRTEFPEITTGTLLANYGSQVTILNKQGTPRAKFLFDEGFFFADPEFFTVFKYKWLAGKPDVLQRPNVTVLPRRTAEKYFGTWQNALGKMLLLDNSITVEVAGILENPPRNTDYPLQIVTSFETVKANPGVYFYTDFWGATTSNFQLFMLLPEQISVAKMNAALKLFSDKYYKKKTVKRTNFLRPLRDIHFDTRFDSFGGHTTSKSTLLTLSLIAIFIVIMACINFINLSTAQAVGRSKEIGVRKVLGAFKKQLFIQVLAETFLIVLASLILGILIALLFLPGIKNIATISEPVSLFTLPTICVMFSLLVTISLAAGFYPAMVLSGFRPVVALKNKITSATVGGINIRRGLVIAQFAISQILIIGTVIAVFQMGYIRNADLGFNKDEVLVINANIDSAALTRQTYFKQQLLQIPGIASVSFSSDVPSSENTAQTNFGFNFTEESNFNVSTKMADVDYFTTFGIDFLAGRAFIKSDTLRELVINEVLLKKLGFHDPNKVLGKVMRLGRGDWLPIVGVVKDFKTNTLRENIQPLVMGSRKRDFSVTAIKLHSTNIVKSRQLAEERWNDVFPEYAFRSAFLNENIEEYYRQDQQLSLLYKIFAGIAIFLSCLGLYGLVTFMASQKEKEIGIRKVLGASVQSIVYLFSREFVFLIFIGFIIAIPAAWYMMSQWLNNFVFRIEMSPLFFLMAIIVSLLVAVLAVGYKSLKAALGNPVKSLRRE